MLLQGNALIAKVNTDVVMMTVANEVTSGGFVGIGSGDYGYSDWDDLSISRPVGNTANLFVISQLWVAALTLSLCVFSHM